MVADLLGFTHSKTSAADLSSVTTAVQGFLNNVVAAAGYGAALETPEQMKQSVAVAIGGPRASMDLDTAAAAAHVAAKVQQEAGTSRSGSTAAGAPEGSGQTEVLVTNGMSTDDEDDERNTFHLADAASGSLAASSSTAAPAAVAGDAHPAGAAAAGVPSAGAATGGPGDGQAVHAGVALLLKDAFLVFRALCKLSIRTSDTVTVSDPTAVRGKVRCGKE